MQKKLIAVAVAGALAAPAAVLAQSTVQMSGSVYMEYGFTSVGTSSSGATNRANVDMLQAPGSNIAFKGTEKLGGGMSAWFQCESSADFRGVNGDGFCTRNSAVGFRGGFGNFFIGIWDTPFKRTIGNTGARDTGLFGSADLLVNNSTSTTDGASAGVFKRRQRNSINYDSPVFGGFQVMGAFSSTNSSTGTTTSAPEAKPRIWSLGAQFKQGRLELAAGWEKHTKAYNNGVAGAAGSVNTAGTAFVTGTTAVASTFAGDEDGWHLSAAYTFGNGLKLGGVYTDQDSNSGIGVNNSNKAWQIGADWKIAGPHSVHFAYTRADDSKGTVGSGTTGRPVVTAGGNTGARMWQLRYQHALSKRTWVGVGYVNLRNDSSANYVLGGTAAVTGAKGSAVAFNVNHSF